MPEKPLILTGFMGSGKSSVGRVLAQKLSCPFIDLDAEIVSAAGRSINEIFAQAGEVGFRAMERECLGHILQGGMAVIATGGGAVIDDRNRRVMRSNGTVVHLFVSLPQVLARLLGTSDRPLLAGGDATNRVKSLMDEREHFYADADIRIDTNDKSVEDVSAEILRFVRGLSV